MQQLRHAKAAHLQGKSHFYRKKWLWGVSHCFLFWRNCWRSAVVNQNYMGCSCTAPFCLGNFMMLWTYGLMMLWEILSRDCRWWLAKCLAILGTVTWSRLNTILGDVRSFRVLDIFELDVSQHCIELLIWVSCMVAASFPECVVSTAVWLSLTWAWQCCFSVTLWMSRHP